MRSPICPELPPRTPDEEDRQQAALTAARALPVSRRTRLSPNQAVRQAGALTPTSGAGPSGWRSSRIQLIASTPNGPAALTLWATAWVSGEIDAQNAPRWTSAQVRLFYTANGKGVRPVICSEALLKCAIATPMKANLPKMGLAFGPRQCGAGRAGCPGSRQPMGRRCVGPHQRVCQRSRGVRARDCVTDLPLRSAYASS